jgi:hypothetical protein
MMWRKEPRKANGASIELEKKQPELDKITDKNAAAQEKRNKMTKRKRVV